MSTNFPEKAPNVDQSFDLWATRGDYWSKKVNPPTRNKVRRPRKNKKALVLNGHGIRLNVEAGTLLIRCGFTHYPQEREKYRFFPGDRRLPSRIIILDGDGSITLDALEWLSTQKVSLVQLDWKGQVSNVGGAAYAADPVLVEHQRVLLEKDGGMAYAQWLIAEKIKHACETLKIISSSSPEAVPMIKQMKARAAGIKKNRPSTVSELLNEEAIAAMAYFRYWYTLEIKWRGNKRKPVPEEWKRIGSRRGQFGNRNDYAGHPANAILNYAYGMLENQVRRQILAAGLDPSIGYLHNKKKERDDLVFDLMEPCRPIIDLHILEFILSRTFQPDDFVLNKSGVVRLHPQFARYVVKLVQDIPEINKITEINLNRLIQF